MRTSSRLWKRPWGMLEARGEPQEPDEGWSRAPGEGGLRVLGAKHADPRPPPQSEQARNAPVVGLWRGETRFSACPGIGRAALTQRPVRFYRYQSRSRRRAHGPSDPKGAVSARRTPPAGRL